MTYSGYLRQPHYYETDQMGIIHHSNYYDTRCLQLY